MMNICLFVLAGLVLFQQASWSLDRMVKIPKENVF